MKLYYIYIIINTGRVQVYNQSLTSFSIPLLIKDKSRSCIPVDHLSNTNLMYSMVVGMIYTLY